MKIILVGCGTAVAFPLAVLYFLDPSVAVLSGVPQFIVTSINFLITTGQSRYLMDVESSAAEAVGRYEGLICQKEPPKKNDVKKAWDTLERHKINWQIFLFAWWCLTCGSMLGIFRVLISVGYYSQQTNDLFFIRTDVVILCLMFLGYGSLAVITARAWGPMEARGHRFPEKPLNTNKETDAASAGE